MFVYLIFFFVKFKALFLLTFKMFSLHCCILSAFPYHFAITGNNTWFTTCSFCALRTHWNGRAIGFTLNQSFDRINCRNISFHFKITQFLPRSFCVKYFVLCVCVLISFVDHYFIKLKLFVLLCVVAADIFIVHLICFIRAISSYYCTFIDVHISHVTQYFRFVNFK